MVTKGLFGFNFFGTFMRNKILDNVPNFQGKMSCVESYEQKCDREGGVGKVGKREC